jgi:hypothetical protein
VCFAKILCALRMARFPAATAGPSYPFTLERQESLPEECGRFRDARLVRIRQPDRTGGAALPVVHEKGRDLRLWCEFFRLAFPPRQNQERM